ncbi:MAG: hypothetical protein IH935_10710 [Acidobacteria bacterium]|nr:hypothetical protein [Acidobacteriota bacterium]
MEYDGVIGAVKELVPDQASGAKFIPLKRPSTLIAKGIKGNLIRIRSTGNDDGDVDNHVLSGDLGLTEYTDHLGGLGLQARGTNESEENCESDQHARSHVEKISWKDPLCHGVTPSLHPYFNIPLSLPNTSASLAKPPVPLQ